MLLIMLWLNGRKPIHVAEEPVFLFKYMYVGGRLSGRGPQEIKND